MEKGPPINLIDPEDPSLENEKAVMKALAKLGSYTAEIKARKEAKKQKIESFVKNAELSRDIGRMLGEMYPGDIKDKKLLTDGEKSLAKLIWTILWATPFIRSANKLDRRWENAKATLMEPFTAKTLGDLFKKIGSEAVKM